MAWATDPFYASRIALYYGSVFISYFTAFHYAYIFSHKLAELCKNSTFFLAIEYIFCCTLVERNRFWSGVVLAFVLISGLTGTFAIFVVNIPVNNSIESSADGVTTIYNGAVVLIGILLAHKIGGHFLHPFSVEDALKDAMKQMDGLPFDKGGEWQTLPEEERLTEVIKALIHRQTSIGHKDTDHGGEANSAV